MTRKTWIMLKRGILDPKHRERILECLKNSAVPLTRRQISELTRIPINAVCGRVNTLLASELVRVAYEDEDQGTGTSAQFLEPVRPTPIQRTFAWNL